MGEVIDISDRRKFMARIVEDDAVQLVEIGNSGQNYCLTLSKNALIALRDNKTFPLELLVGDKKMKINVMRDNVFKAKIRSINKISEHAKDTVKSTLDASEDTELGKSLGEKVDQE